MNKSVTRQLIDHFFRRFFDNDTIQVEGDTTTTIVRAISAAAVPGLIVAFFLQTQYPPHPPRHLWATIQDQYFFVLFSLIVMGAVTIFEWEMLFPDRLDFLILSPLSIKPRQMLAAKATALAAFLTLFLVAANFFGALMLPAVSKLNFFRHVYAHTIATLCAGVFAALFFLALGGVLLCLLDAARFRMVSPIVQMLSVAALLLLMLQYLKYGDSLQAWLAHPAGSERLLPPLWFLGIYEQILHGASAPAFAGTYAVYGFRAIAIAALVVVLTYPVAWARMRRMAVEGASRPRRQPARWLTRIVHGVISSPAERAVFHFITQTIARNNRYQVYLAMYSGTGLAIALACAVGFRMDASGIHSTLNPTGLHAIMPLLLFWVIAGLRTAFAFPLNLSARWVFRVTGVDINRCAAAARKWVFACALFTAVTLLVLLKAAHWDARHLLVQTVCGLVLCTLLTDGFFYFQQTVPFNQPRMPGRTNLPLLLTLYIGAFPPFILGVINFEAALEKNPLRLIPLALVAAGIHIALEHAHRDSAEVEEEMEGYDGEFQLLNLSITRPINPEGYAARP